MSGVALTLSSAGMQNVGLSDIQGEFVFVIGDTRHTCPRGIAQFLSPTVCLQHSADATIAEYVVETNDKSGQFQLFMSLGQGSSIQIPEANRDFFLSLSRELGNSDLYRSLVDRSPARLTPSHLCSLCSEESIAISASEFCELTLEELDEFSVANLIHILSRNSLRVSSEDSLFSFIRSHIIANAEYWDLFQFVRFEYLSRECISDFLSIVPERLDYRLWAAVSPRLLTRLDMTPIEFPLPESKPPEGIISYLTQKYGGNVHDKGIVTITSKSSGTGDVRNVADLNTDSKFYSKNEPNQWICWDFQNMRIRPTYYRIENPTMNPWIVESSLDGSHWTVIDRKTDNDLFWGTVASSFEIAEPTECRFIRLRQTGKNRWNDDVLFLSAFEVFGTLFE
jgi:hypothetical protein